MKMGTCNCWSTFYSIMLLKYITKYMVFMAVLVELAFCHVVMCTKV